MDDLHPRLLLNSTSIATADTQIQHQFGSFTITEPCFGNIESQLYEVRLDYVEGNFFRKVTDMETGRIISASVGVESLGSDTSNSSLALDTSVETNLTYGSDVVDTRPVSSGRWNSIPKLRTKKKSANSMDSEDDDDEEDDDDSSLDLAAMTNVIEDRWSPQIRWSIAPGPVELKKELTPLKTSRECYLGLVDFFQHAKVNATSTKYDEWLSAARLSVATESSSHLTGIRSLNIQPWVYAGGGLGNADECLSLNKDPKNPLVHVCLAGGTSRDSLTFASACVVSACSAEDIFADDFPERVATAGFKASTKPTSANSTDVSKFEVEYQELLDEYVTIHKRIARVGEYLNTGWVCGEYIVDWELFPALTWCVAMLLCTLCTILRTRNSRRQQKGKNSRTEPPSQQKEDGDELYQHNNTQNGRSSPVSTSSNSSSASSSSDSTSNTYGNQRNEWFWSAWDAQEHMTRLTHQREETACLDGLKVGSILWVIGAHVMAIQSSTGAGYINPKDFFPPKGITTTLFGQLLFSSRYAVDTFLCVSGYLAATVLQRKLKHEKGKSCITILKVVAAIFFRILRIMPLYLCCLGFWMFLAPHMGSGPFWYQWEHFLEPCRQLWWTNLLFVNNFLPLGAPTEANCFYHSWYLAVDVQLFCIFAPWLVLVYQSSPTKARKATLALWLTSVVGTALLAYTQEWSINSFDGYSIALFDVEGYAKPHVRAQSYLAGIFVAFLPRRVFESSRESLRKNNLAMILALSGLAVLSFVTVTGAYSRRACTFEESPFEGDDCGSTWSYTVNFLYTAFSRAAWSICVAILLHLCILGKETKSTIITNKDGSSNGVSVTRIVNNILGWSVWTPLAHLSFGAYLIHPIVIYIWFLGGRQKVTFRLFTYIMEFTSITVVTFLASFAITVLVEFPFGVLLRPLPNRARTRTLNKPEANISNNKHDAELVTLLVQSPTLSTALPSTKTQSYGSLQQDKH